MNTEPLNVAAWQRVVAYLGERLVRFMIGTEDVWSADTFTADQVDRAWIVASAAGDGPALGKSGMLRSDDITRQFCTYIEEAGHPLAIKLHFQSGGTRPYTGAEDPLEEALCKLAVDAYPLLLVSTGPEDQISTVGPLYRHPLKQKVDALIFQDSEPLMSLFPDADFTKGPGQRGNGPDVESFMSWNDGTQGPLQLVTLIDSILRKSNGAAQPGKSDLESYVTSVRETLAVTRQLAQTREATLFAIAGCPGATLAPGVHEIRLGEGRLRRLAPPEMSLVGCLATDAVVLEFPIKVRLEEMEASSDPSLRVPVARASNAQEFQLDLLRKISRAHMAVLLASGDGETLSLGKSFVTWANPATSGHTQSQKAARWRPTLSFSRPLDIDDEARIMHWYALVGEAPKSLYTGQERLISAVNERDHPYDGFIDAVIVWENLFGAAGETMLRVCGALAHVLHPSDSARRVELFKRAKTMYNKRSKLVHGGDEEFPYALAYEYWKDSVQYAITAWRRVLESDSLREHKNSASRGTEVLINGVSP